MIDEVKLRKKKDEEINYMLSEPLQKAWTTFEPMLVHVIQLLQFGCTQDVQYVLSNFSKYGSTSTMFVYR
jgi:hypothetical protein